MYFADILNTSTDMLVMNQSEDYRETQEDRYRKNSLYLTNGKRYSVHYWVMDARGSLLSTKEA